MKSALMKTLLAGLAVVAAIWMSLR